MSVHIKNRELLIHKLREELVGPAPYGSEIDCAGDVKIQGSDAGWGPYIQKESRQEIIVRESPRARYGVGVLYPVELPPASAPADQATPEVHGVGATDSSAGDLVSPAVGANSDGPGMLTEAAIKSLEKIKSREGDVADPDTLDLSAANTYRPSVMGITFLAELPEGAQLVVEAPTTTSPTREGEAPALVNGRYIKKKVEIAGKERQWWLRQPVHLRAEFNGAALRSASPVKVEPRDPITPVDKGLDLRFEAYSRPSAQPGRWLVTVCLVNRSKPDGDETCLFQTHFRAWIEVNSELRELIHPYPTPTRMDDPEEQALALLYRNALTFAVGHGCSADWVAIRGAATARQVRAECLPLFEAPSITPEVFRKQSPDAIRESVEVPMAPLAGLVVGDDGMAAVEEVVDLYSAWIGEKRKNHLSTLDQDLRDTAIKHLNECESCLDRMRDGLAFLKENSVARRAFELANHAILIQQARSRVEIRRLRLDLAEKRPKFTAAPPSPDLTGKWRPFQIAFILMSLRSAMEGNAPDRKNVELIWFPTGGGKTEAYLGLAAFSIFARRLYARHAKSEDDAGTHVLMRYTLRLLTTQQFQRASALMCAMEFLRRQEPEELGSTEFSIGIWVGGANTPNSDEEAREALRKLQKDAAKWKGGFSLENPFVVTRCPWCAAQLGPLDADGVVDQRATKDQGGKGQGKARSGFRNQSRRPEGLSYVYGYRQTNNTVEFVCPDQTCEFYDGLPIYVIDEAVYRRRPTLVIGTVDKFALLAWRPKARGLFGIAESGKRDTSPPGLIIQDELHLISGPLGSMVGLYEVLIEELCTDRRAEPPVPPKIVSSTATIRRYREQIRALYARQSVTLFPPPGLDAGDSFFAQYAKDEAGKLAPGRVYVGVHGTGTGSLQTDQVRAFTALLQAPMGFKKEERDPWWTLLVFFNSLRVLGSGLSLFQADIPEHVRSVMNREGLNWEQIRRLNDVQELTGRLRNTEVPLALEELSVPYRAGKRAVDVCLASNIIEVGVDIDRLSLMSVVGQPKTTSQYIQVTGRVGRKWWERPGLVVTIYIVAQPRDRSLYEKFRSYHERLYAQVEPTSVTPFSLPALERGLHAVLIGYIRQTGDMETLNSPRPVPQDLIDKFSQILHDRAAAASRNGQETVEHSNLLKEVLERRAAQWTKRDPRDWDDGDLPLMYLAGSYASGLQREVSWATPMSMRGVDAECRAEITQLYLRERMAALADSPSS